MPTKVKLVKAIVKAIVFPVVMCGGESWNIRKAERRIDASELGVGVDS